MVVFDREPYDTDVVRSKRTFPWRAWSRVVASAHTRGIDAWLLWRTKIMISSRSRPWAFGVRSKKEKCGTRHLYSVLFDSFSSFSCILSFFNSFALAI